MTEEGEGEGGAAGQAAGGPEEGKGEKQGGTKEATHNSVSEEQEKGSKKNDEEARKMEEEARKKEEEEETKPLVKSGAQTLLPVLGEEVTAKVSCATGWGLGSRDFPLAHPGCHVRCMHSYHSSPWFW